MPAIVDIHERKVRRAEKRAKQREASITRAEKMHDARLADQSALNLDYHLEIKGEPPAYHIGCSGWFYCIGLVFSIQRTYPVMNGSSYSIALQVAIVRLTTRRCCLYDS
ncbi:MAG: hypothetical protein ABIU05_16285 [Nitrospirales bacterium]